VRRRGATKIRFVLGKFAGFYEIRAYGFPEKKAQRTCFKAGSLSGGRKCFFLSGRPAGEKLIVGRFGIIAG
jgi:hypothetical protein